MKLIEAIILGVVQGLTEFLPISSSAHLRIVGAFLPGTATQDPGAAFTAIIQLGTEAAVLIYFWRDIVRIVSRFFLGLLRTKGADGSVRVPRSDPDYRMGWLIIVGTIPIGVLGLLFQQMIETTFRSLWIVAIDLIVFGILLGIADHFGRKWRTIDQLSVPHGVIFGFAQALALVPGVSRSGGTIGAGLVLGYTRAAAARYSFLLAIPAVWASGLYEVYDAVKHPCVRGSAAQIAGTCAPEYFSGGEIFLSAAVAFVVGFAVIAWFLRYLNRGSFLPFIAERILMGVLVLGLLLAGVLKP